MVKVAIYSRKSKFTGKGDSIENQIELCKEYCTKNYNNDVEFLVYEDEGFSGGNTNRPQFQKLLKDVKSKKINALICYRLDRISRNVADFSATLELLQANNCDFISIKEQFDTSTPMGRAMVYISSVFAQLERETIAERIKDNMYELAKSGRWLGGQTPLGFNSEKIIYLDQDFKERNLFKLTPVEDELEKIKFIFELYAKEKSIHKVLKECLSKNLKGKNGGDFHVMSIRDILRNPVYVKSNNYVLEYFNNKGCTVVGNANGNGLLSYGKVSNDKANDTKNWIIAVSKHTGIIAADVWLDIQNNLDKNSKPKQKRLGTSKKALLTGVLKCSKCGAPMRICYGRTRKDGTKNYYYMCTMKAHSGKTRCDALNLPGPLVDASIIDKLENINTGYLIDELKNKKTANKSNVDKKIELNKKIDSTDKKINQLIKKLADANDIVTKYIMEEINKIDKEKNEYINELLKLENNKDNSTSLSNKDIDYVIDTAKNFKKTFQRCNTIEEKRILIESFVEEIKINGETGETHIYYWGAKKK